jgi:hypothetical protein
LSKQRAASSESAAFWLPFLAAAVGACIMPASADTFWQLRAGQDIVAAGRISLVDHYSHTALGRAWPDHEWLWQVATYAVHSFGGIRLLTAFAAAFVLAALALAHRLSVGPWWTRMPLFLGAIALSRVHWDVRPQVFTMLALLTTLTLVTRRRVALLPLLFLLWANVHGGVVLGFLPLAAGVAVAAWRGDRRLTIRLSVALLACAAATLATPLGTRLYPLVRESMERSRIDEVEEWAAVTSAPVVFAGFLLVAAPLVVGTVRAWRLLSSFEDQVVVATALLFIPPAALVLRNVAPFALLALPAATRLIAASKSRRLAAITGAVRRALEDDPDATPEAVARHARRQIQVTAGLAATAVALAWWHPLEFSKWSPMGPSARAAVEACPAALFNEFDRGGYLIWFTPGKPVFIDGRQDPYPLDFLERAGRLGGDAGLRWNTFARYDIRCAALDPESPMVRTLVADGWGETYRDGQWVVLSRSSR